MTDFPVSTTNAGNQTDPQIAVLANGGFVVTWYSYVLFDEGNYEVRGRVFAADGTPVNGTDFLIPTTFDGEPIHPQVAALASGGFAVTWSLSSSSGSDIRGRVFAADGTPANASDFLVPTTNANNQHEPQITALSGGGFAVTWTSYDNGSNLDIRGRVFAADGTPVNASDFLISTAASHQKEPRISALAGGGFVVTWRSESGSDVDIHGRVYAADGTPVNGSDFLVSTTTNADNQSLIPDIAALSNGGFAVTWHSNENGSNLDIRGRVFTADGTPVNASDFLVSTANAGDQARPDIVALSNGGFVIAWQSDDNGSDYDIRGRVFAADGTPVNGDFLVSTANADDQLGPQIAALSNGGFAVTWGSAGPSDWDTRGRVFAADGTPVDDSDFLVSTTNPSSQVSQQIAALPHSSFAVAWASADSGRDTDIRGRVFAGEFGGEFSNLDNTPKVGVGLDGTFLPQPDPGGSITYQWQQSSDGSSWTPIAGADQASFTPTTAEAGRYLRVTATTSTGPFIGASAQPVEAADGETATVDRSGATGGVSIDVPGSTGHWDIETGSGSDTINTGSGNDTMIGGAGGDRLTGGSGNDTAGYAGSSRVLVNLTSGFGLYGDAEGDTLTGIENLFGTDYGDELIGTFEANSLRGWGGADQLLGGDGADTLLGDDGDDFLVGAAGADSVVGGLGRDKTSYVDSPSAVRVDLGANVARFGDADGDVLESIEVIVGSQFNDELFGDDQDNDFEGLDGNDQMSGGGGADALDGDAGDDRLSGDDGDDFFVGGDGADQMQGGEGLDRASYATSTAVRIDLDLGTGRFGEAEGDTFGSIEGIVGSSFHDQLFGDIDDNLLFGFDGNDDLIGQGGHDLLEGGNGNDRIWGGDGIDTLLGGAGADQLQGGGGYDTVAYYNSSAVSINLAAGTGSGGEAEGDTFGSIEEVIGSSQHDTLTGDNDLNRLQGLAGNDTLDGRERNDILEGGLGLGSAHRRHRRRPVRLLIGQRQRRVERRHHPGLQRSRGRPDRPARDRCQRVRHGQSGLHVYRHRSLHGSGRAVALR